MTNCTASKIEFLPLKRKKIEAEFSGGDITSDAGALLLREVDNKLGLLNAVDKEINDPRNKSHITHSQLSMLKQRVYGIALGYEDLNDHEQLRLDPAIQTAVNKSEPLASQATLCRLENRTDRKTMMGVHKVFLEQFIASFDEPPTELILDFDGTDDPTHGQQPGSFYNGYYHHYCYFPLYVFCNEQLLVSYLRPSNLTDAKHSGAILRLLVNALRKQWPEVRIIYRADGGFYRHKVFNWCERHNVEYIVGASKNARLSKKIAGNLTNTIKKFEQTQEKQRDFMDIQYAADTWIRKRRIIAKLEVTDKGTNPRFIVTNIKGDAQALYDELYCARGDMENRIKEQQLGLFADRTSTSDWWANQFRLLLSSLGYLLLEGIRRLALKGSNMEKAQSTSIRIKLLKVGAVVIRNTRRIRFLLPDHYPYKAIFTQVAARLASP